MREISCEDTPTPRSLISTKLDAFSTKFDYHGFPEYAQQLSDAVHTFLQSDSAGSNKVNCPIHSNMSFYKLINSLTENMLLIFVTGERRLADFGFDVAPVKRCIQTRNFELIRT